MHDRYTTVTGSLEPLEQLTEIRLYGNNLEEMPKFGKGGKALEVMELHTNRTTVTRPSHDRYMPVS